MDEQADEHQFPISPKPEVQVKAKQYAFEEMPWPRLYNHQYEALTPEQRKTLAIDTAV